MNGYLMFGLMLTAYIVIVLIFRRVDKHREQRTLALMLLIVACNRQKRDRELKKAIDPVCIIHGKKHSEHEFGFCLYCCLCFKTLTPDTCHAKEDGTKEDVCEECAAKECSI